MLSLVQEVYQDTEQGKLALLLIPEVERWVGVSRGGVRRGGGEERWG